MLKTCCHGISTGASLCPASGRCPTRFPRFFAGMCPNQGVWTLRSVRTPQSKLCLGTKCILRRAYIFCLNLFPFLPRHVQNSTYCATPSCNDHGTVRCARAKQRKAGLSGHARSGQVGQICGASPWYRANNRVSFYANGALQDEQVHGMGARGEIEARLRMQVGMNMTDRHE
jgi:hypothetical protein